MSAAETARRVASPAGGPQARRATGDSPSASRAGPGGRGAFAGAVVALLALALALRVWGIDHGMPWAYNADENAHYVPRAIGMFGHDLNPGYFVNPPAFTYVLHLVLAVRFGGGRGVAETFATDPAAVWVTARLTAAVLSTAAVGLIVWAGVRLFGRATGLLAGALLAVAFLPVFYSHQALNDAPALAPISLALVGAAGILRGGGRSDWVIAGVGLGLAGATKYTAGIVLLAILAAAVARARGDRRSALAGLATAGGVAAIAFLVANPYAVLDARAFLDGIAHQSSASGEAAGKLGLTQTNGWLHYLWALTWGFGWAPLGAAALGAGVLARRDRAALALLLGGVVVFVVFMGAQERFFGRWVMPILPHLCLLAAVGVVWLVRAIAPREGGRRIAVAAVAVAAVLVQGLIASVHVDRVLARTDTRNEARAWLERTVPEGRKVVIEPIVPGTWAQDVGRPSARTSTGDRWLKWPTTRSTIDPETGRPVAGGVVVTVEDYVRTLHPGLIDAYRRGGYCWVVTGSHQRGRALAEPERAARAVAYYRRLARESRVAARFSPYDPGAGPVRFDFDWSFVYYPLAFERPGPDIKIHRLRGQPCGPPVERR